MAAGRESLNMGSTPSTSFLVALKTIDIAGTQFRVDPEADRVGPCCCVVKQRLLTV